MPSEASAGPQSAPVAEPVDIPVEPAVPGHEPPAAEAPDDTDPTATEAPLATPDPRAEDVAAPEESAEQGESEAEQSDGDNGDEGGDDTDGGGFSLLHVPIKRKGSRKR